MRGVVIAIALCSVACASRTVDLLSADGGATQAIDDGAAGDGLVESDAGAGTCAVGGVSCELCPPPSPCATCSGASASACPADTTCRVGAREAEGGTVSCDDSAICGEPAGSYEYCRVSAPTSVVTVSPGGSVVCLEGLCELRCEGACEADCRSGQCTIQCPTDDCTFAGCPTTPVRCAPGDYRCGIPCGG